MTINISSRKLEKPFTIHFGCEDQAVFIVDDFHPQPNKLVEFACDRDQFSAVAEDFYPGIKRSQESPQYFSCLKQLEKGLVAAFDLSDSNMTLDTSCYAISNTQESELLPIQCVPHFDTTDSHQIAVVHYLCDEACGGTSFYRHRATDYEEISADRLHNYQKIMGRQATTHGLPPAEYICDSTHILPVFTITLRRLDASEGRLKSC